jgi:hypothetical protein
MTGASTGVKAIKVDKARSVFKSLWANINVKKISKTGVNAIK